MKKVLPVLLIILFLVFSVFTVDQRVSAADRASVSIWLPGTDDYARQAFTQIINNFKQKHPGVDVEFQQIPWGEYFTKLNVSFAGGTSPDIFGLGYGQMGPVNAAGRALALNDYLEGWDGWSDIPQNILNAGTKDGKLYGILMPEFRFLLYRKDMFASAGLDTPPVTTDQLKEYARKLTQKDGNRVTVAGLEVPSTNGFQFLLSYLLMSGAAESLWTDDLQPVYDSPQAIAAIKEIKSYYDEGLTTFSDQLDIQGTLFENGLAAMTVNAATNSLVVLKEKIGAEKLGMALPPENLILSMGTFLAVSNESEHKAEAIELFKDLTSKEGQLTIARYIGFVPTRKSAAEDYIKLDPQFNKMIADNVENARVLGVMNPYFFDFNEALNPALEKVYYGKESAEAAMEKAASQYQEAMEQ